jgi:hypothetical protein
MNTTCAAAVETTFRELPVRDEIERFLSGETDGGALFEALYGTIGDEPIPERFLGIVRSARPDGEVIPMAVARP